MDALVIMGLLLLLSKGGGASQTTVRHVGDIVVNSFSFDRTEIVTSPRSSFKVKLTPQPGIIEQFRGDPRADFIAVYGRATG